MSTIASRLSQKKRGMKRRSNKQGCSQNSSVSISSSSSTSSTSKPAVDKASTRPSKRQKLSDSKSNKACEASFLYPELFISMGEKYSSKEEWLEILIQDELHFCDVTPMMQRHFQTISNMCRHQCVPEHIRNRKLILSLDHHYHQEQLGDQSYIVNSMKKWMDCPIVLAEACSALANVHLYSPIEAKVRTAKAGAIDIVLEAMEKYPKDYQIQVNACAVLSRIVENSVYCATRFISLLGLSRLGHAMKTYPKADAVQEYCCEILEMLTQHEEFKQEIRCCSEAVVLLGNALALFEKHSRSKSKVAVVSRYICRCAGKALRNLSVTSPLKKGTVV